MGGVLFDEGEGDFGDGDNEKNGDPIGDGDSEMPGDERGEVRGDGLEEGFRDDCRPGDGRENGRDLGDRLDGIEINDPVGLWREDMCSDEGVPELMEGDPILEGTPITDKPEMFPNTEGKAGTVVGDWRGLGVSIIFTVIGFDKRSLRGTVLCSLKTFGDF